jgi:hypothetical protein
MWIDPLFARLCSLSRLASLDLERFTTPSKNRRFTSPSVLTLPGIMIRWKKRNMAPCGVIGFGFGVDLS